MTIRFLTGGRTGWLRPLRPLLLAVLVLAALVPAQDGTRARADDAPGEPPLLGPDVTAGRLPPLATRLPSEPRRDLPKRDDWVEGRYGGEVIILDRGGRDARSLTVLGYARLLVWDEDYRLVPDILAGYEIKDGRRFTLRLRPGHKWSDGTSFTSEDFRFWWHDVANHPKLSPRGLPPALLVEGEPPLVEFPDAQTVRFTWSRPNAEFLPALASTNPPFIYRPAHYLKRFHPRYRPWNQLDAAAREAGAEDWTVLFERKDRMFRLDNPSLPTLQPWVNETEPPAQRFRAVRNPYFHRVDAAGRQLPYIDRITLAQTSPDLIAAKTAAGESDLQAIGLTLRDFTLLKEAEPSAGLSVRLWPIGRGAQLALYPNLNVRDPVWRAVVRDVRVRRALSLAIDRAEINQVVYKGLASPGANTVLPASPLHEPGLRSAWASYEPSTAERLLDAAGLVRDDGGRRLPDGRPFRIVIETAEVVPEETDVLELIAGTWGELGIELVIAARGRQAARQRVRSGEAVFSLFYGLANGIARPSMSPAELAPTSEFQNNWPLWGLYHASAGRAGVAPDLPAAQRLLELYRSWVASTNEAARAQIWREMLEIHAQQVFTIGIVGGVLQPVVARRGLRNLPEAALFLYEPGAYFGIYRPDTFWFAPPP